MAEGLEERARRVNELLADRRTAFFVVTSPERDSIDEAIFFHRRLREGGLPFGGVIVNRMHEEVDPTLGAADVTGLVGQELGRKVARTFEDYRRLAERDRAHVALLERELDGEPMIVVPYLDDDVHDIDGLERVNERLFAPGVASAG